MNGLALVTGAGTGLGLAYAEGLAKRGYDLFLISLPGEGLADTSARISMTYDVRCHFLEGDLCSPEVRRLLLEQVMDTDMDLHVIVNNAGLGSTSPFFQLQFYITPKKKPIRPIGKKL